MTFTQKETDLIKDMQNEEKLCIQKYDRYAACACAPELKQLLTSIADTERSHLQALNQLMSGTVQTTPPSLQANNDNCAKANYTDEKCRNDDAFMCRDLLATEKHASSLYNTSIFEFNDPAARRMLNHIQSEEQQHGEQLYAYMTATNMGNA